MGEASQCPVSVVIPAYNRSALIGRALASVQAQHVHPAEVIVVDDNSSDDTAAVAERAGARVIRHTHNRGPSAARNTAVAASTQPWVAVLDSDDEWLSHHLAALWPLCDGHDLVSGVALTSVDGGETRLAGYPRPEPFLLRSPADLLFPENPVCATAMLRRKAVDRAQGWNEELWFAEDLDLYVRILEGGSGLVVPKVTAIYRQHPDQATEDTHSMRRERRRLVERYSDRQWSTSGLRDRALAVTAWDEMRAAMAARNLAKALQLSRFLLSSPQRLMGLLGLFKWRRAARTGGRRAGRRAA